MRRKTAPKVKRGRVQKKNNWALTPNYYSSAQPLPVIDRRRPGDGYRHLLKQRDIVDFIAVVPDWPELARGLNAIVLDTGGEGMGWQTRGVVAVSAWEKELWWTDTDPEFVDGHHEIFAALGVVVDKEGDRLVTK